MVFQSWIRKLWFGVCLCFCPAAHSDDASSMGHDFSLRHMFCYCSHCLLLFCHCYWRWIHLAYNFGCRALYNLPWRASVSSHQVQCNNVTFLPLLRKYKYLFLERCRKSNNAWLRALMQSDCLYSSLFFEHCSRILLCEWVIELCSVHLIDGVSSHNAFAFYLD